MTAAAPLSAADAQALWREGARALREGDAAGAGARFRRIVEAGRGDATVWLALAMAARAAGEAAEVDRALDAALELEPRNLRALMLKADHLREAGDPVSAATFYRAVAQLGGEAADLPADLRAEVARARAAATAHAAEFEAFLVDRLEAHGLGDPGARRVRDSLDMLLGKKRIYLQEPTQYFFPELPQLQFYPRETLPWLDAVEAAADDIREELHAVLAEEGVFKPYVEGAVNRPTFDRGPLYNDPSWSAFYLVKGGVEVAENAARCPRTMAALAGAPLCAIPDRTPSVLFSLLRPGARIPPHTGLLNTRLICHLPLIVPDRCGFRVGNDVRPWVEGRAWAFDDSIEHEAWNESDALRVVLIFDVWKPELTPLERDLVSVMVEATRRLGGGLDQG